MAGRECELRFGRESKKLAYWLEFLEFENWLYISALLVRHRIAQAELSARADSL